MRRSCRGSAAPCGRCSGSVLRKTGAQTVICTRLWRCCPKLKLRIAHPKPRIAHPKARIAHPKLWMASPKLGIPPPKLGIARPESRSAYPRLRDAYPKLRRARPRLRIGSPGLRMGYPKPMLIRGQTGRPRATGHLARPHPCQPHARAGQLRETAGAGCSVRAGYGVQDRRRPGHRARREVLAKVAEWLGCIGPTAAYPLSRRTPPWTLRAWCRSSAARYRTCSGKRRPRVQAHPLPSSHLGRTSNAFPRSPR